MEAEADAAHRFIIDREVEAPDRFGAIQSYRAAMAVLRQQATFVGELFESGGCCVGVGVLGVVGAGVLGGCGWMGGVGWGGSCTSRVRGGGGREEDLLAFSLRGREPFHPSLGHTPICTLVSQPPLPL